MVNVELLPKVKSKGNLSLLDEPLTALLCSNRCPGDLILKTYDLARAMARCWRAGHRWLPDTDGARMPAPCCCGAISRLYSAQPAASTTCASLANGAPLSTMVDCWSCRLSLPQPDGRRRSSRPSATTWWRTSPSESSSPTQHPEARRRPSLGSSPPPVSRC